MFFKRKATGEGSTVVTADSKAWFKAEFDPIDMKMTILFQADSDFLDFLTANMITLSDVDFCRADLNLDYDSVAYMASKICDGHVGIADDDLSEKIVELIRDTVMEYELYDSSIDCDLNIEEEFVSKLTDYGWDAIRAIDEKFKDAEAYA